MRTAKQIPAPQLHMFQATQVNLLTEIESHRKAPKPATTSTGSSNYSICLSGITYAGRTGERTYQVTARTEDEARAKALELAPGNWQTGTVKSINKI